MAHSHLITLQKAAQLTANYRNLPAGHQLATILTGIKGEMFKGEAIQEILDQPGCEAIRFYYGIDMDVRIAVPGDPNDYRPKFTLVAVGVNSSGNDMITGLIMDKTIPCPKDCSTSNALTG